jgi:hypothetical protein
MARASGNTEKEDPNKPNIIEVFLGDFNSKCPSEVECTAPFQKKFSQFTNWKKVADDGTLKHRLEVDPKLRTLQIERQLALYYYPYDVKDFLVASKRRLTVLCEDILEKLEPKQLRDVFNLGDHFPVVFNIDLRQNRVSAAASKRAKDAQLDGPSKRTRSKDPTPDTPLANRIAATPHDAVS